MTTFSAGDTVRVDGMDGVAFRVYGWPKRYDSEDEEWVDDPDSGFVVVVAVGDDRKWTIDIDDVSELSEDDYCGSCGQIGCGHG